MQTQSVLWQGQARAITDAIEAWKRDPTQGLDVWDLEAVLHLALEAGWYLRTLTSRAFKGLFAGEIANVLQQGELLLQACEAILKPLREVRDLVARVQQNGCEVARADELSAAIEAVLAAQDRVVKHWPRFDVEELRRGCEAADRGDLLDAEEVLRELEGVPHF